MRILFIDDRYSFAGGKEKYLFTLAASLRNAGHVTAFIHSIPAPEGIKRDEITFCVPGLDSLRNTSKTIARLKEITGLFQPDVLHLHYNVQNLLAVRWLIRHYPLLRSVHDVEYLCPTRYYLRADTQAQCDARCGAVCLSAGCVSFRHPRSIARLMKARLRQRLYSRGASLSTQSEYIRRNLLMTNRGRDVGVLPIFREPVAATPISANMRFLYVGRLHRLKGPQVAVEAMMMLPSNVQLEIVGAGMLESGLQQLVRFRRLQDRVVFSGHLDGPALHDRFNETMCVLVPSLVAENCPLSIQEAMAFGRPVIASNVGGIPELVEDEVTGYLVPPGDAAAMAAAMMRLCDNPSQAAVLGANGLKKISEPKYSLPFHLQELARAYKSAIHSFVSRVKGKHSPPV